MPIYEYECLDCSYNFDKIVSSKEKDEIICPKCSSITRRLFSSFYAKVSDDNTTLDNRVGRMSEKRWEQTYKDKDIKRKIREKTGCQAISKVYSEGSSGVPKYFPTPKREIEERQRVRPLINRIQSDGVKVQDSTKGSSFVDKYILPNK